MSEHHCFTAGSTRIHLPFGQANLPDRFFWQKPSNDRWINYWVVPSIRSLVTAKARKVRIIFPRRHPRISDVSAILT